jgi:hypothetical protein
MCHERRRRKQVRLLGSQDGPALLDACRAGIFEAGFLALSFQAGLDGFMSMKPRAEVSEARHEAAALGCSSVTFWDSRATKEVKSLYLTSQVMDDDRESILSQFAKSASSAPPIATAVMVVSPPPLLLQLS